MGMNIQTFYGYGYYFNKSIEELIESGVNYTDSPWYKPINNGSDKGDFFFGLILKEINEDGECYEVPIKDNIDYHALMEMLDSYKKIFKSKPGIAHHYIIQQIN